MPTEPVLCYVYGCWAYFTTQPLAEQWGDDWDDAPYEHNAGLPYTPTDRDMAAHKSWRIIKVAFDADMESPCHDCVNSPYSVRDINGGAVAWLRTPSYVKDRRVFIPAGTSLRLFKELIFAAGGKVYEDVVNAH